MKKFLSIILAVTMIMSLICVVPAQALEFSNVKLPYAFVDFEDGKTIFLEGNNPPYSSAVVDSGDEARGKVAEITVKGSANGGPGTKLPSANIGIGDKITISAWVKSAQALKSKARLSLIFFPTVTEGNVTSYKCWPVDFDKNNTDWQYVTATIVADWAGSTGTISYRWGDTGGLNYSAADTPANEETGAEAVINDRTYWVDNFELKIEKAGVVTEKAYPYEEVVSLTPEDGSSWNGITVHTQGKTDTQTVVTEDGNTFLRHTHSAANAIWYHIQLKENMKAGHTYVLTFKSRVRGLPLADGTLDPAGPSGGTGFNYVNYQPQVPYSNSAWTGESNSKGSYEPWSVHSAATRRTGNGPYADIRWNGATKTAADYADWHDVSITFSSAKQNIEEDYSNQSYIRLGTWLYNGAGTNLGTYDFDDFKVVDLGPLTNGSFENSSACAGSGIHDGSNSSQWIKSTGKQIGGWHSVGAHGATQALKNANMSGAGEYGALYYQLTEESQIYQYVPVYAGEKYEIKGYVRGAKTTAYTEGRARLVADFTGETLDKEVYDVLSLGENGIVYGDWVEFSGSYNANAPMVLNLDLTNIGIIEGREKVAGIMPKSPKLTIEFDEEWEGNVNPPNGGDHAVYMDAFTMTRLASDGVPSVTAGTASMDLEGAVTFDYTYATAGNVAEATDASVYKLVSNGRCYGTFYDKNAVVAPAEAITLENLSLEIVPVSATGHIGETVTIDIEMPELPEPEPVIELFAEDGQVTVYSDTDFESAQLIYVSYDANGKMVDVEVADATIAISADVPETYMPLELTEGATTVAMLWTDFDGTYKPMTASVSW